VVFEDRRFLSRSDPRGFAGPLLAKRPPRSNSVSAFKLGYSPRADQPRATSSHRLEDDRQRSSPAKDAETLDRVARRFMG